MGLAKKDGALLLAVVAAVCIQLYQGKTSAKTMCRSQSNCETCKTDGACSSAAQYVVGRCRCYNLIRLKDVKGNITGFEVKEKSAACNKMEFM